MRTFRMTQWLMSLHVQRVSATMHMSTPAPRACHSRRQCRPTATRWRATTQLYASCKWRDISQTAGARYYILRSPSCQRNNNFRKKVSTETFLSYISRSRFLSFMIFVVCVSVFVLIGDYVLMHFMRNKRHKSHINEITSENMLWDW